MAATVTVAAAAVRKTSVHGDWRRAGFWRRYRWCTDDDGGQRYLVDDERESRSGRSNLGEFSNMDVGWDCEAEGILDCECPAIRSWDWLLSVSWVGDGAVCSGYGQSGWTMGKGGDRGNTPMIEESFVFDTN